MTSELLAVVATKLLLWQLPVLVVAVIGLWYAMSKRERHARASAWAAGGFGLLILHSLVQVLLQVLLVDMRTQSPTSAVESVSRINLWGVAAYPLFIAGITLLARAVFIDRDPGDSI